MLRRQFIQLSTTAFAASIFQKLTHTATAEVALINHPDEVWVLLNNQWLKTTGKNGSTFSYQDVDVTLKTSGNAQSVFIQSPVSELQGVRLKWKHQSPVAAKILGDHWERGYGDLGWRAFTPDEKKPWYVLINDEKQTSCFGVKTGANTICYWTVSQNELALTMDTHSGGVGVKTWST